jgi:hypothetical protein
MAASGPKRTFSRLDLAPAIHYGEITARSLVESRLIAQKGGKIWVSSSP